MYKCRETIMLNTTFAHQGFTNVNFPYIFYMLLKQTDPRWPPLVSHFLLSMSLCNSLPWV